MLDIQQLRSNLDAVAEGLAKRGKPIDFSEFKALEAERKTLQTRTQESAGAAQQPVKADRHVEGAGQGCRRGDGAGRRAGR